jgi:nitrate reductase NapE component
MEDIGWFVLAIVCWIMLLVGAVGAFALVEALWRKDS